MGLSVSRVLVEVNIQQSLNKLSSYFFYRLGIGEYWPSIAGGDLFLVLWLSSSSIE